MQTNNGIKGIYLIVCIKSLPDEKRKYYVGQAKDIFKRLNDHCLNKEQEIDNAISKYGVDNFSFNILEKVKFVKDLDACEEKWINRYIEQYGDEQMYNIAKTTNKRKGIPKQINDKVTNLFKADLGRSIYAIAEYFNLSYEDVIKIRKPLLKKNGLKWVKGKIIYEKTGLEPENWRGFSFTKKLANRIKLMLDNPNYSKKDISFVSKTDLEFFLNSGTDYNYAQPIEIKELQGERDLSANAPCVE